MIVSVSRSAPRERFELICPPTHALFSLFGYRFPKFFFSFTISVDISSQFPVGGFMTLCLTYPSLSVSLPIRLFFSLGSCHYSPLSSFQRTQCSCKASDWCAVCFCCLISPSSHWSWPLLPWSGVALCSVLDWILLLLLLWLSVSYGSQPWVSALSLSEQDAQAMETRGREKIK